MNVTQEQLTEEQIKEREQKMFHYYEEKLPFLKKMHEHDMLLADISEARIRRLVADRQYANAMSSKDTNKAPEEAPNSNGHGD